MSRSRSFRLSGRRLALGAGLALAVVAASAAFVAVIRERAAYEDLALRGLADKGGVESDERTLEAPRAGDEDDAMDVLSKLGQEFSRATDPAVRETLRKKIDAIRREQRYYALAYAKPPSALPVLESAVLDVELEGRERYAALEALAWWDTEEAITVLEGLRRSFAAEEDGIYLVAIEGAINRVRATIAAKSRPK